MLAPFVITLALAGIGTLIVAKVTQLVLRRLQLDPFEVLEWLGLAEAPVDQLSAYRMGLRG